MARKEKKRNSDDFWILAQTCGPNQSSFGNTMGISPSKKKEPTEEDVERIRAETMQVAEENERLQKEIARLSQRHLPVTKDAEEEKPGGS